MMLAFSPVSPPEIQLLAPAAAPYLESELPLSKKCDEKLQSYILSIIELLYDGGLPIVRCGDSGRVRICYPRKHSSHTFFSLSIPLCPVLLVR